MMHKIFIVAAFTLTADAPFAVQCRLQTLHLAVLLQVAVQQSKQPLQQAAVGEPPECLCQQQYGSSILLHLDKAAALCRCFGAMTGGSWPTATQHVGLHLLLVPLSSGQAAAQSRALKTEKDSKQHRPN